METFKWNTKQDDTLEIFIYVKETKWWWWLSKKGGSILKIRLTDSRRLTAYQSSVLFYFWLIFASNTNLYKIIKFHY